MFIGFINSGTLFLNNKKINIDKSLISKRKKVNLKKSNSETLEKN